ncbi:alpha-hydroxy-acid oxidizing protein [Agromyces sp. NPDC049794]|uniref:alpha-hydroxy-acid oxidizing protein n=1 Tax=unclassified Agromyces TaxID=2639701 RepID=UPI00340CEFC9
MRCSSASIGPARPARSGLIATLDWSFSNGRDWGSPWIPEKLTLQAAMRFAPQAVTRPAWLLGFLKTGRIPDLTAPNLSPPDGGPTPTFFGAYFEWISTPPATWDDIAWLREQWRGPFMLKGNTRIDDAKRAVDAGVTAISVSNHGGNNLDTTPASIRMLPGVADAVGDQVEVLLDGGIRCGGDVAKALALGARAVMIGRAYLRGSAANGQAGVENVFDVLRGGLDSAELSLGHSSIDEHSPADFYMPPGFRRELGERGRMPRLPLRRSPSRARRSPRRPVAPSPSRRSPGPTRRSPSATSERACPAMLAFERRASVECAGFRGVNTSPRRFGCRGVQSPIGSVCLLAGVPSVIGDNRFDWIARARPSPRSVAGHFRRQARSPGGRCSFDFPAPCRTERRATGHTSSATRLFRAIGFSMAPFAW